jgi:hypothetical protein
MAINPSTGLYYQPNVISWLYPYLYNKPASSVSVQDEHSHPAISPDFQQSTASAVGTFLSPIQTIPSSDPSFDRIVGGSNLQQIWTFMVSAFI